MKAISLDMWPAYLNAYRNKVPGTGGKMVSDRLHIMRHVLVAVVRVKKHEHKVLMKAGDDTLSRRKYL
jgi:transposase